MTQQEWLSQWCKFGERLSVQPIADGGNVHKSEVLFLQISLHMLSYTAIKLTSSIHKNADMD